MVRSTEGLFQRGFVPGTVKEFVNGDFCVVNLKSWEKDGVLESQRARMIHAGVLISV